MLGKHLREEHDAFRKKIEHIREIADLIRDEPSPVIHNGVDATLSFVLDELLPHAKVEEQALYPVVANLMGGEQATRSMKEDHRAIEKCVNEIADVRKRHHSSPGGPPPLIDIRRILYSLHAIISLHLEKEETIYIPLLESKLTEKESEEVIAAVEKAAAEIFGS